MAAPTFVAVSDQDGFVGAFRDADAARAALRPYLGVPFVYYEWRRQTAGDGDGEDLVWALPYKNGAVACVSDVKAVVETAQTAHASSAVSSICRFASSNRSTNSEVAGLTRSSRQPRLIAKRIRVETRDSTRFAA